MCSYSKLFDEGFNNLSIERIPPNVTHLQCPDDWRQPLPNTEDINVSDLQFYITTFAKLEHIALKVIPSSMHNHLGFRLSNDELLQRLYITDIAPKSPAACL